MTNSQRIWTFTTVLAVSSILHVSAVYANLLAEGSAIWLAVQTLSILSMIATAIPLHRLITTDPPPQPGHRLRELDPGSQGFFVQHAGAANTCLYRISFRGGVPEHFEAWLRQQTDIEQVPGFNGKYEVSVNVSRYRHFEGTAIEIITNHVQTWFKDPVPA